MNLKRILALALLFGVCWMQAEDIALSLRIGAELVEVEA